MNLPTDGEIDTLINLEGMWMRDMRRRGVSGCQDGKCGEARFGFRLAEECPGLDKVGKESSPMWMVTIITFCRYSTTVRI